MGTAPRERGWHTGSALPPAQVPQGTSQGEVGQEGEEEIPRAAQESPAEGTEILLCEHTEIPSETPAPGCLTMHI